MSIKNFNVKNGLTVGTATIDAATGNIVAGNANLGNLATANFFGGNANALFNIQGANVVGTVANATNASTAGTVTTNAQPNITSVGTLSSLSVTGNVSAGNILTNNLLYANGTPWDLQEAAGSNTQIQYNDNGDFGGSSSLTFNETTSTVTANNFNVSNVIVSTRSNLGSVSNVIITGGSSGYFLQTNGSGVLTWEPPSAGATISNGTSNLNIGTANGNITASVNGVSNVLVISTAGLNVTGNIVNSGNTVTSGNATITGNITSTAGTLVLDTGVIVVSGTDAGVFNTTINNINIGLAANVTLGSPGGNVTARGNLIANNFRTTGNLVVESTATITNLKVSEISSNRTPVSVTVGTVIDSFSVNKYRSAKYTMRVNSDDGYQAVEALLIHDNTNSYVTIYGSLSTIGTDIIVLSTNIVSGNVRMLATTASTNTTVNLLGVYVAD